MNLLLYWLRDAWARLTRTLDWPLCLALGALMGIGLAVLYSAGNESPRLVLAQGLRYALGIAAMWALSRLPPYRLRNATPLFYALSIVPLIAVLLIGSGKHSNLWINLGVFYFQPSELWKLALPMMLAWHLDRGPLPPRFQPVLVAAVLMAVPIGLILLQPDFGTAMLVAASGVFVLFLAGLSWWWFAAAAAGVATMAPVAWFWLLRPYQKDRILTFLDPESDPMGAGWNIIQSKIAIGGGGLFGKGWGQGTQSHLDYLPEHTTDFVFAVLSEEFGWIGVAVVLALYLFVIGRCLWIAGQARDGYSRLLAGALGLSLFVYVLVNGGMISGLLPVVGVPMPLLSYGGTAAVSMLAGMGVVMAIRSHRGLNGWMRAARTPRRRVLPSAPMTRRALLSLVPIALAACAAPPPKSPPPQAQTQVVQPAATLLPPVPQPPERPVAPASVADPAIPEAQRRENFVAWAVQSFGVDANAVRAGLAQAQFKQNIIDAMNRPAEAVKPWRDYRPIFLNPQRIDGGRAFYAKYRTDLDRIAAQTGVPAEIIVAIIGVETQYGANAGKYRALDALSTLAFGYPKRAPFFAAELAQLFALAKEEGFDPAAPVGSYAGAMGWGQFMPSSWRNWGRDGDGDGRRDLLSDPDDVFASVANYFVAHGWQRGAPVAGRADKAAGVPDFLPPDPKALDPVYPLALLESKGYHLRSGEPRADGAVVVALDGDAGREYWLGYRNFYVITRYNRSPMYAMAVWQLSQAIAGAPPP